MRIAETLARVAELTTDAIVVTEPGPPGGGAPIVYVNAAFERLTGYAAREALGQPVGMLYGPLTDLDARRRITEALAAGRGAREVLVLHGRDGRLVHVDLALHPVVDADGRMSAVIAVHHDITERWRFTEALREAKEAAEAANLAKTRFIAGASHDLRQPLNAMSLLLGVLRNRLTIADMNGAGVLPVIDQLQHSLDAMMELFNGLLDLSHFETGAVPVNRAPVRADLLLHRIVVDFAGPARAKGLRLRVLGCDAVLWTDAMLLERVVRNLVANAVRYTPAGGRVLVGCRRRGDALRIDVVDDGPGIPADQVAALFEEFRRGAADRPRGEGHGLGLAIVKHACALLEHAVEVASVPGRGSRFSVTVPQRAEAPLPTPPPPTAMPPTMTQTTTPATTRAPAAPDSCRVLLIEDDPLVASAMAMTLEDLGCDVRTADSADEAALLARATTAPFALILADVHLSGGRDGFAAIEEVRRLTSAETPAGIISGDVSGDLRERAERLGAHCLTKPIRPAELKALVDAAHR